MNSATPQFDILIADQLEGELTTEQHAELQSLLRDDSTAQRDYARLFALHAMLDSEWNGQLPPLTLTERTVAAGEQVDPAAAPWLVDDAWLEDDAADVTPLPRRIWEATRDFASDYMVLSLVTSALVITTIVLSLALWIVPAVVPENTTVARPAFVAQVAGTSDATWADATATELAEGRDLYVGQAMVLIAGSAEIRYDSGVRVRVFGPAQWTIPSAKSLNMQQGRAVAFVTPNGVGFTIGTPLCDVIDLGTEFAVGCEPEGNVNVYVHEGEVEIAPATTDQKNIRLTAGESLTVSRNGTSKIADAKRRDELKRLAVASGVTNNFETWRLHRDALKTDESLVAYYDFQCDAEQPDKLVNIAVATAGKLHGQLGDPTVETSRPTWTEGRFRGKQALKFDGTKSPFVRIALTEPIEYAAGITVAMWVRFDGPVTQPAVLVAQREGAGPYAFQMAVMPPSHSTSGIQFLASGAAGPLGGYSGEAIDFGVAWQLLMVTSNEQETIFYRNGRAIGRAAGTKSTASDTPISIGVNFERGALQPWYAFHGAMDELMIFNRAISASEASKLFAAGRPSH